MIIVDCSDTVAAMMAKLAIVASGDDSLTHEMIHDTAIIQDLGGGIAIISIDKFDGRQVKFYAEKEVCGWKFPDIAVREFQPWAQFYPSYKELYNQSVGLVNLSKAS